MSKKESAIALAYNPKKHVAPMIVASGYGDIARRMIQIAEQQGIPVYRDDQLVSMMSMLKVGEAIDEELYELIAKVYVEIVKFVQHSVE